MKFLLTLEIGQSAQCTSQLYFYRRDKKKYIWIIFIWAQMKKTAFGGLTYPSLPTCLAAQPCENWPGQVGTQLVGFSILIWTDWFLNRF